MTEQPLTSEERERLRTLALNALEDGAWHNAPFLEAFIDGDDGPVFNGDDTAFIEAVSPAVVLRLLAAVSESLPSGGGLDHLDFEPDPDRCWPGCPHTTPGIGRCWFCKGWFRVEALIAGYDTFEEQRLACLACNERMTGNWRPNSAATPSGGIEELRATVGAVLGDWYAHRINDAECIDGIRHALYGAPPSSLTSPENAAPDSPLTDFDRGYITAVRDHGVEEWKREQAPETHDDIEALRAAAQALHSFASPEPGWPHLNIEPKVPDDHCGPCWRAARAALASSSRQQEAAPPCGRCGGPHQFDTSIASPLWNRVIREAGLPDYLCTSCIVWAFVRAGESFEAELYGEAVNPPDNTVPTISVQVGSRPLDQSYGDLQAQLRSRQQEAGIDPDGIEKDYIKRLRNLIAALPEWTGHPAASVQRVAVDNAIFEACLAHNDEPTAGDPT